MTHIPRILIVVGSPDSDVARTASHRRALRILSNLSPGMRCEVIFLDVLPDGRFAFPEYLSPWNTVIEETFSRWESTEMLTGIRLDFALPMLEGRSRSPSVERILQDLNITPLAEIASASRSHLDTDALPTAWEQLSQISVN